MGLWKQLVFCVDEFPEHPEFIGEFSIGGAPKALVQGHFYLAAGREAGEELVDLFVGGAFDTEDHRVSRLQAFPDHVGPHHQQDAVLCETAVEDIGRGFGGHLHGEGGLGYFLQGQVTSQALLVEGHRFAAATIEVEVGIQLGGHSISY